MLYQHNTADCAVRYNDMSRNYGILLECLVFIRPVSEAASTRQINLYTVNPPV